MAVGAEVEPWEAAGHPANMTIGGESKGGGMAWMLLVVAGLFEIGWATGLKFTEGFSRLWPSIWTAVAMVASLWLLAVALKSIPVGTAYAVWTGIGAAGTAVMGILLFGESRELIRILSILVIVAGIVGLKLSSPE